MLEKSVTAIEFFSGIGAFHEAAKNRSIDVIQAFDQSQDANQVYSFNYGLIPSKKNLVSVSASQIEKAQLWWLSPPCTPFSRRGNKLDEKDPRSHAFINLISLIGSHLPDFLLVENVDGFQNSTVNKMLLSALERHGYFYSSCKLCSTEFSVPMRRPRAYLVASRICQPRFRDICRYRDDRSLLDYLKNSSNKSLNVAPQTLQRYHNVLNIVDPNCKDTVLICFTSGYFRCKKASGSLLDYEDGVKYAHPIDIANLLGFSKEFKFPHKLDFKTQWRLVGNSVDVRAINYLLSSINL